MIEGQTRTRNCPSSDYIRRTVRIGLARHSIKENRGSQTVWWMVRGESSPYMTGPRQDICKRRWRPAGVAAAELALLKAIKAEFCTS